MSMLIDEIKKYQNNTVWIHGKAHIKRFVKYFTLRGKIKDCIKILRNKAIAVHFKEDDVRRSDTEWKNLKI